MHPPQADPERPGAPGAQSLTTAEPAVAADISAAALRRQIAVLAEQVRALGNRVERSAAPPKPEPAPAPVIAGESERAAVSGPPAAPVPSPTPAAELAAMLRRGAPDFAAVRRAADLAAPPEHRAGPSRNGGPAPAVDGVIEMAQRAAAEIRENARREAARIRAGAGGPAVANAELVMMLKRQRETLGALTAETERIEQAVGALRVRLRALDAERLRMVRALLGGDAEH